MTPGLVAVNAPEIESRHLFPLFIWPTEIGHQTESHPGANPSEPGNPQGPASCSGLIKNSGLFMVKPSIVIAYPGVLSTSHKL